MAHHRAFTLVLLALLVVCECALVWVCPVRIRVGLMFWLLFGMLRATYGFSVGWSRSRIIFATVLLVDPQAADGVPARPLHLAFGTVGLALAAQLTLFALSLTDGSLLRVLVGGAAFLLLAASADATYRGLLSLVGLHYAPFDRAPLRSRSLTEFWGTRWNRLVGGFFRDAVYRPLRPRLGTRGAAIAAFCASAAYHFVPIAVCRGWRDASAMGAFFVVHGVLALAERGHIQRVPSWVSRVWTYAVFVATLPLFVQPLLRCFLL